MASDRGRTGSVGCPRASDDCQKRPEDCQMPSVVCKMRQDDCMIRSVDGKRQFGARKLASVGCKVASGPDRSHRLTVR